MANRPGATLSAQGMLDGICEALRGGMAHGERRIHVSLTREIETGDGLSQMEFITVEAFRCADDDCPLPFHVRVHAAQPRYEYPQHLAHRGPS